MTSHNDITFYCICLTQNQERFNNVINNIVPYLPNCNIVEAVDGTKLTETDLAQLVHDGVLSCDEHGKIKDQIIPGREMTRGAIGAFLSHIQILKTIAGQIATYGVILEDDISIVDGFYEKLSGIIDRVNKHEPTVTYDYLNFNIMDYQKKFFPVIDQFNVIPPGLWGLQIYLVRKDTASKIVQALQPMISRIDEQITRVGLTGFVWCGENLLKSDGDLGSYTNTSGLVPNITTLQNKKENNPDTLLVI